jgi:multisubunit Na+/H+ antiporter MnhE subunit
LRTWLEITTWWVVLVLVWIATLTAVTVQELVAAAILAVPCAVLARLGRQATGIQWPMRAAWLRWPLRLPWAVLHDTVAVLALALRPDRPQEDRFRALRLPEQDSPNTEAAQQAAAAVLLSAAPGSVVVDVNDDRVLVHELPIGSSHLDEAIQR